MEQHPDLKITPVEQVQEKDIHIQIFGILSEKVAGADSCRCSGSRDSDRASPTIDSIN
jgi:hypothetical protein